MHRSYTNIIIQQLTNGRNLTLKFDFVNEWDATDTWVDLTNQATVKIPKNIYAKNANGQRIPLFNSTDNIGGFDNDKPLFLRGDKITIDFGYRYIDSRGNDLLESSRCFTGYIAEITSKKPIELKCEDNMWLLKQIPAKPQTWTGSVESLFASLLKDYPQFTVKNNTSTNIGTIVIGNETVAQLLARLRKDAHIEAFFRGDTLHVGGLVYLDANPATKKFVFQKNIISDELMYKRKDDVVLSAVVISKFEYFTGKTTKDGQQKTKKQQIELLVYWNLKKNDWDYIEKTKTKDLPTNTEGERTTLTYLNITDKTELFNKGVEWLKKYFYTGFKGKFTTFGIPFVKQGDNVIIEDAILPERNGKYKVRGVEYSGGTDGQRQTIILDYKIS